MLISVFFFGNPDRGDDSAGQLLYDWAEQTINASSTAATPNELRLIYDFQLEPEHIFDLEGCDLGVFVDCVLNQSEPTTWSRLETGNQIMFTSHSVTPESLLFLFESTFRKKAPPCYLLGITGTQFELGSQASKSTQNAIEEAKPLLISKLTFSQKN